MVIAVPFGLGAAIFVSEFCGPRLRETFKIVIELLAAIPSVVWGFIGLTVMSRLIVDVTGTPVGVNMLNGGIILALMSVPIIVSIGEDALKAVPDSYREAGLALGATRWQLVYRVLLPAAKNGLLAAVLLGVGRAVGETMAVLMATGHAVHIPNSILDSVRTLTANIAAELGEAPARFGSLPGPVSDGGLVVQHHVCGQSDRGPGHSRDSSEVTIDRWSDHVYGNSICADRNSDGKAGAVGVSSAWRWR